MGKQSARPAVSSGPPHTKKAEGTYFAMANLNEADASMALIQERKHVRIKSLDFFNLLRKVLPSFNIQACLDALSGKIRWNARERAWKSKRFHPTRPSC